ncbi:hypothetical protein ISCGN_020597 [Ixodes scapularis]
MPQYSASECAQAVKWYVERNSVTTAQRKFRTAFHKRPPSRPTILTWANRFMSGEDFKKENPVSERESLLKNEELIEAVLAVFESDPQLSTRRAARLFGISEKSVRRILRKNNLRPYKMQVVQALHDGDNVRRLEFCKAELLRIKSNPGHLQFLLFSDEANFHLWTCEPPEQQDMGSR